MKSVVDQHDITCFRNIFVLFHVHNWPVVCVSADFYGTIGAKMGTKTVLRSASIRIRISSGHRHHPWGEMNGKTRFGLNPVPPSIRGFRVRYFLHRNIGQSEAPAVQFALEATEQLGLE